MFFYASITVSYGVRKILSVSSSVRPFGHVHIRTSMSFVCIDERSSVMDSPCPGDDTAFIATSAKALQVMLDITSQYCIQSYVCNSTRQIASMLTFPSRLLLAFYRCAALAFCIIGGLQRITTTSFVFPLPKCRQLQNQEVHLLLQHHRHGRQKHSKKHSRSRCASTTSRWSSTPTR
jgi:hypothetical protein